MKSDRNSTLHFGITSTKADNMTVSRIVAMVNTWMKKVLTERQTVLPQLCTLLCDVSCTWNGLPLLWYVLWNRCLHLAHFLKWSDSHAESKRIKHTSSYPNLCLSEHLIADYPKRSSEIHSVWWTKNLIISGTEKLRTTIYVALSAGFLKQNQGAQSTNMRQIQLWENQRQIKCTWMLKTGHVSRHVNFSRYVRSPCRETWEVANTFHSRLLSAFWS